MSESGFDKLLVDAVDEGLSSLGEPSKQAIYFHLERSFNVKKLEIPHKIEDFAEAIQKIFGLGANFLEILIMKRIYEKVGGFFDWQESGDLAFVEYIQLARRAFQEKEKANVTMELIQCEEVRTEP